MPTPHPHAPTPRPAFPTQPPRALHHPTPSPGTHPTPTPPATAPIPAPGPLHAPHSDHHLKTPHPTCTQAPPTPRTTPLTRLSLPSVKASSQLFLPPVGNTCPVAPTLQPQAAGMRHPPCIPAPLCGYPTPTLQPQAVRHRPHPNPPSPFTPHAPHPHPTPTPTPTPHPPCSPRLSATASNRLTMPVYSTDCKGKEGGERAGYGEKL